VVNRQLNDGGKVISLKFENILYDARYENNNNERLLFMTVYFILDQYA